MKTGKKNSRWPIFHILRWNISQEWKVIREAQNLFKALRFIPSLIKVLHSSVNNPKDNKYLCIKLINLNIVNIKTLLRVWRCKKVYSIFKRQYSQSYQSTQLRRILRRWLESYNPPNECASWKPWTESHNSASFLTASNTSSRRLHPLV